MSFNHHKWQQRESADRTIVSFIVASNPSIIASTKKAFYEDMRGFCEAHGGTFKDLSAENSQKFSNLVRKFSYQEESRYFECGPVGRGTKSNDWTKFNPATCRKLYETNADMQKVRAEYGTPANFHCVDKTGVRFMITAGSERYNTSIGPGINLIIRVNEATKGIITPVSGKIDME